MFISATSPRGARVICPTNDADVLRCVNALAGAFKAVPCTVAFSRESAKNNALDHDALQAYVDRTVRESLRLGAALVEAGGMSAVALWELPHRGPAYRRPHMNNHSPFTNHHKLEEGIIKKEWMNIVRTAKKKYIGTEELLHGSMLETRVRPHYHLDFLGRNPGTRKVAGAVTAVVQPYMERAREEGLSVWLEATSEDVVPLYEHYGFSVVEEILVGKGRVDSRGELQDGGVGVKAWLMMVENSSPA